MGTLWGERSEDHEPRSKTEGGTLTDMDGKVWREKVDDSRGWSAAATDREEMLWTEESAHDMGWKVACAAGHTAFQEKWCQPFLYDSPGTLERWHGGQVLR